MAEDIFNPSSQETTDMSGDQLQSPDFNIDQSQNAPDPGKGGFNIQNIAEI